MKSLDDAIEIIQALNEQAHSESWDSWIAADEFEESDEEDSDTTAESLREDASLEQAQYFRDFYAQLPPDDQSAIKYWIKNDASFRDEFSSWYGEDEFEKDFEPNS